MLKPYCARDNLTIYHGDCLEILPQFAENSIATCITDPPAGISFMGKKWDSDKGGRKQWVAWLSEVMNATLRILKPGGHALVWALPRTSHWTGWALEEAGFEIRDRIAFLFGSGLPKSLNVSKAIDKMKGNREIPNITKSATPEAKQWDGYGSALKPAIEDWWLCRKPLSEKTIAENCLKWGIGALWIDGCRIGTEQTVINTSYIRKGNEGWQRPWNQTRGPLKKTLNQLGRFPSHCIHDGSEEVLAEFDKYGERKVGWTNTDLGIGRIFASSRARTGRHYDDTGSAARFFYGAKASKSERGEGNNHPTVKSLALMEYLCRLTKSPVENDIIIDPFMGSGSTLIAAYNEGRPAIGIEINEEYCEIAVRRIKAHS